MVPKQRMIILIFGIFISVLLFFNIGSTATDNSSYQWDTLTGHSDIVSSVVFSKDGKTIISGSHDKTIKIWNYSSGTLRTTLTGHSDRIQSVAFSPNGKLLASGSSDKTVKIWNMPSGTLLTTIDIKHINT